VSRIAVVGAGAWGTALSAVLARRGNDVVLWAYEHEVVETINCNHVNTAFLPDIELPETVAACNDITAATANAEFIYFAVPSEFAKPVVANLAGAVGGKTVVIATKGIDQSALSPMSDLFTSAAAEMDPVQVAVISGPSFAQETAAGMPTAIVVASSSLDTAARVQRMFQGSNIRLYSSTDVVGVQIAGSAKNIIAIAAGISDGLGYGHNARAALITRGAVEIARLGRAMGARVETFSGLAGIGDLVLTCTGDLSRNRTVGLLVGRGKQIEEIRGEMRHVAEGIANAKCFNALRLRYGIEMPITEQVHAILYKGKPPGDAVDDLMSRELKSE